MGIKSQAGQWLTFPSRNWEPMAHSEGHPQLCGVRIPPIPPCVHLPAALSPAHFPTGGTHWDVGDGSALRSGAAWRRLRNGSASPSRTLVSQDMGRKEERAGPCAVSN